MATTVQISTSNTASAVEMIKNVLPREDDSNEIVPDKRINTTEKQNHSVRRSFDRHQRSHCCKPFAHVASSEFAKV